MADAEYRKKLRMFHQSGDTESEEAANRVARRSGLLRNMTNEFRGYVFYSSSFNPDTGTLIRGAEEASYRGFIKSIVTREGGQRELLSRYADEWRRKFSTSREQSFSPVPETVDVAINTWCNYGCDYCYMDATTKGIHAPLALVEKLIQGFDQPPYQIAYGGGSPTHHPEFVKILEKTRELGVVPNYTTEGQNLTPEILAATSATCGGVALTFHTARGVDVFKEKYLFLRKNFSGQLNVHVIADKNVVETLRLLREIQSETGTFNVVLLAYYPTVGRGNMQNLMPKQTYMVDFPDEIKRIMDAGNRVAFSEGLIPYFLSRPEIGIDTQMAVPVEGRFSCYVDVYGRMSKSSFDGYEDPPGKNPDEISYPKNQTIYDHSSQDLWNHGFWGNTPDHNECDTCQMQKRCSTPDTHHYLICKWASHNDPSSQPKCEPNYRNEYF